MIEGREISYRYDDQRSFALKDVDIQVAQGELIAVLGHNGCGKSTLAKHLNALLRLQKGSLTIAGIDASGDVDVWRLRRKVGMVFQCPDNQFVSSVVEDDIAFGPENYMIERDLIPGIVADALDSVDMKGFERRAPHTLSGGQKQRVALAGVLALDPDILIFDEATAMLDPEGRSSVIEMIKKLNRAENKTVIMATHYIEESIIADRIILMKDGEVIACGSPQEILTREELLRSTGLTPPFPVRVALDLEKRGMPVPEYPLTEEGLVDMLCR